MSVPTSGRPSDTVLSWYDTTRRSLDPWVRAWAGAADDALTAAATPWDWWTRPSEPAALHPRDCRCGGHDRVGHGHDCGCGSAHGHHRDGRDRDGGCDCDRAAGRGDPCRSCVVDADLVVTARPNERRVVPIELRNTWHRDRTLTVSLGQFTADQCGPDAPWVVTGTVDPSGEVTLLPCSHTTLELVLEIGARPEAAKGKADTGAARPHRATTYYADLSLPGCGRAQRLAVVVLPERCGAYHVSPSACCC